MTVQIKEAQQWHFDAYEYWIKGQLGHTEKKGYKEVATYISKSVSQVSRVAVFYEWKKKLDELRKKQDDNFAERQGIIVNETRRWNIEHDHAVSGWIKESDEIHKTLLREKRKPTPAEKARMTRLESAIRSVNPKDSRDRTMDLKENVHFTPAQGKGVLPEGEGQKSLESVVVTGPTLIIMAPQGKDGKKQIEIKPQPEKTDDEKTGSQDAKPV
jgi:hypothetical protein